MLYVWNRTIFFKQKLFYLKKKKRGFMLIKVSRRLPFFCCLLAMGYGIISNLLLFIHFYFYFQLFFCPDQIVNSYVRTLRLPFKVPQCQSKKISKTWITDPLLRALFLSLRFWNYIWKLLNLINNDIVFKLRMLL